MRKLPLFVTAAFFSLTILSCQKNVQQPAPANLPGASAAPAPAPAAAPASAAPAKVQGQAQPQQQPGPSNAITLSRGAQPQGQPAQAGQARPLASAGTLMALGRVSRSLPEDFKIGPLGDDRGDSADADAAVSAAEAFLSGLVAGRVDQKLLSPDTAGALSDTLSYGMQQGYVPKSFRIGAPSSQGSGEIAARVRLFGADGTSEGEIYLARAGTQWLVSDLQLNLAQMAVKREKSKEKFFPSAYRWLLED